MGELNDVTPAQLRQLIREGKVTGSTVGLCPGYVQANLIIMPQEYAADFKEFARKNPAPCPILDYTKPGDKFVNRLADHANIYTDIPKYNIFKNGVMVEECTDATPYWSGDMVGFLIGCSYSFEQALVENGIPITYWETGNRNSCYVTNIMCEPAGVFSGPMVVSMRAVKNEMVEKAYEVTRKFPHVHGGPVHHGNPKAIGIKDFNHPEYGDPNPVAADEVPVFWGCGITPQIIVQEAKLPIAISHKACHMFVSDILNNEIEERLFRDRD